MRRPDAPLTVRIVARCLPASIRTGIFEPLYEDLRRERVAAGDAPGARIRFGLGLGWAAFASLVYGAPRYFWAQGRVTRFGRATLAIGGTAFVVLALMLVPWIAMVVAGP